MAINFKVEPTSRPHLTTRADSAVHTMCVLAGAPLIYSAVSVLLGGWNAIVFLALLGGGFGMLLWSTSGRRARTDTGVVQGPGTVDTASLGALHSRLRELERLVETDPLTGVLNRRGLGQRLAALHRTTGVLAVFDADGFKLVNDRLGHAAGDGVLKALARTLVAATRPVDLVARWGGDEFVVFFSDTTLPEARRAAARMALSLRQQSLGQENVKPLGLSMGFAVMTDTGRIALEDAVAEADAEMYRCKRSRKMAGERRI